MGAEVAWLLCPLQLSVGKEGFFILHGLQMDSTRRVFGFV